MGSSQKEKSCTDCHTTKTPVWRSGPSGPKTLCNACGIRYAKKRVRLHRTKGLKGKIAKQREDMKVNLMPLGRKLLMMRREREEERERDKGSSFEWGETERAALLLMALSCGVVFV